MALTEATRRRGLTVDDIDALADRAREEYWAEKAPGQAPQQVPRP